MQIQINTDHHIEGHEALAAWATGEVKTALSHFSDRITRLGFGHALDKSACGFDRVGREVYGSHWAG